MFKKILKVSAIFAFLFSIFSPKVNAEEIHFMNNSYILKYSEISQETGGYFNEYFLKNENVNHWSKVVGVYHFPNTSSPITAAQAFDKQIEQSENSTLVKFIENKKQNKAILSFMTVNSENFRNYFEFDIYKYEKHPNKGVILVRYGEKYFFKDNSEIDAIGKDVREKNDEYMEQLILSPTPIVIEKNVSLD